jgi:hypothetical protein
VSRRQHGDLSTRHQDSGDALAGVTENTYTAIPSQNGSCAYSLCRHLVLIVLAAPMVTVSHHGECNGKDQLAGAGEGSSRRGRAGSRHPSAVS